MAELSVVILNYNGGKLLEKCVDSVVEQQVANEIVVLDNDSTDNSLNTIVNKVDKIVRLDNKYQFITGLNAAFDNATYDTIFFMENDILLMKNCLKELLRAANTSYNNITQPIFYQNGKILHAGMKIGYPFIGRSLKDDSGDVRRTQVFATTAFLTTKKVYNKIGPFDINLAPAYYEDLDYSLRARGIAELQVSCLAKCEHIANYSFSKVMTKREISDVCSRNRKYLVNKHFKGFARTNRLLSLEVMDAINRVIRYGSTARSEGSSISD